MVEIVLNEREWIEQAIASQSLGSSPAITLGRLARYYYSQGYKKKVIQRMLEEYLVRCNPYVNLNRWRETLERYAKSCDKYPLIEIDSIGITQTELDVVNAVDGILLKKLLFTLICLAKYGNAVNTKNGGWVNQSARDIFCMANIALTSKRQALMINKLWQSGHIGFSHIVDNTNLNVRVVDYENEPVLEITDFRNLGNQYLRYIGEPYIECQECGLVIKKAVNNHKYCKTCAASVNVQRTLDRRLDAIIA